MIAIISTISVIFKIKESGVYEVNKRDILIQSAFNLRSCLFLLARFVGLEKKLKGSQTKLFLSKHLFKRDLLSNCSS